MSSRDAIVADYGPRTLRAVDDFLVHASEAAAFQATRSGRERRVDELLVEALVIHLGEAAQRTGERFIADHPQLRLRAIIGARDVVAHGDDLADHEPLWTAILRDLPATVRALDDLLGVGAP